MIPNRVGLTCRPCLRGVDVEMAQKLLTYTHLTVLCVSRARSGPLSVIESGCPTTIAHQKHITQSSVRLSNQLPVTTTSTLPVLSTSTTTTPTKPPAFTLILCECHFLQDPLNSLREPLIVPSAPHTPETTSLETFTPQSTKWVSTIFPSKSLQFESTACTFSA